MAEELKCEKQILVDDGKDQQGRLKFYHRKCGKPAAERVISGSLTTAKAVLCEQCFSRAEDETFVSERGWPKGKVQKSADGKKLQQSPRCKPAIS